MAYTGNGTIDNPYLVNNPDDFKYLLELYQFGSMYIKLTSDINFDDSSNINYSLGEGPTINVNTVNKYIDGQGYSVYNLTKSNKKDPTIKHTQSYTATTIILEFRNIHFKNIYKHGNTSANIPYGHYYEPNASAFLSIDGANGGATHTVLFIGCTVDIVAHNDNCLLTYVTAFGRSGAIVKFYKCTLNFINYHRHGPIVFESVCGMSGNVYLIEILDSHINISGTIRNIPNTSDGTYYYGLVVGNMKFIRCSVEINVKLYYVMGNNITNYILLLGTTQFADALLFESSSISINITNIDQLLLMTNVFKVNISTMGGPSIIINNNLLNITSLDPSNTPNLYIIGPDDVNDTYLTNIGFKPPTI